MPRLPRFFDLYPEIEVQVIADLQILDLRAEGIDLAIRFGAGNYAGHTANLLMRDRVVPVCSPKLGGHDGIRTIDALLALPLLHDSGAEGDNSLSDWRSWLDQLGRNELLAHTGQRFSSADLSINAAVLGLGVALARLSLVGDLLANGTLVCPLPLATPTAFSYYLVGLPESAKLAKIVRFRRWLRAEAAATVSTAPPLESPAASR
jgi:LysR family glycine cleavage system transcriptional activator